MKSMMMKRMAAAVLPVAAAATFATVAPASANAAASYCQLSKISSPYSMGFDYVEARVDTYNCSGKYFVGEIFRWVNGSTVRAAYTAGTINGTNWGTWIDGVASTGCWTYYTKVTLAGNVVRSAGAQVCR